MQVTHWIEHEILKWMKLLNIKYKNLYKNILL